MPVMVTFLSFLTVKPYFASAPYTEDAGTPLLEISTLPPAEITIVPLRAGAELWVSFSLLFVISTLPAASIFSELPAKTGLEKLGSTLLSATT